MNWLQWWKGRKWVYLGYTEIVSTSRQTGSQSYVGTVHFYAWQNDMKRRKFKYTCEYSFHESGFRKEKWFQHNIEPWLNGGDIWGPISHPIAVQGNLVNFYKGQNPQP